MEDVKEIGDVRFRHPCSVSVIGSSGTGKTSLILKIIDQIEHVMDFVPTKILYVYGCYQPAFEKFPQVTFYDGWDHPGLELNNLPTDSLLVCDDSVDLHPDKKFFVSFYTRESHHLRVSIITIDSFFFYCSHSNLTIELIFLMKDNSLVVSYFLKLIQRYN